MGFREVDILETPLARKHLSSGASLRFSKNSEVDVLP